jgi:hypothetical protein
MDEQRLLPRSEVMIREQSVAAEGNAQCHDQVRGQTDADDGPECKAISVPRPQLAVDANEAAQHSTKASGARIVRLHAHADFVYLGNVPLTPLFQQRRKRMKQCKPGTACAHCRRRKIKVRNLRLDTVQ